jgi:hypothetical protein
MTLSFRLLSVSLLSLSFAISFPAFADSSDWVQVERFKQVLKEAQEGKVTSMYEVGRKYERGRGTNRNMAKAAEWYSKAANANHAPSMARLGILYVEGNGVKRDLDKAVKLLTEAAEQNVASAQYQLANMYELGTGVQEDLNKAISLYRKAAEGGYYRAQTKVDELTTIVKGNRSAPTKKPAKTAAKPKRVTRSMATVASILQGNWVRGRRPTGYLPSTISQCRGQSENIKCISTAQERSTGTEIITYNTEATLSNFNGKQFRISYVNNVLEVEQQESANVDGYEEGSAQPSSAQARLKAGQQSKPHQLECTLEKPDSIRCVKDKFQTLHFTSL